MKERRLNHLTVARRDRRRADRGLVVVPPGIVVTGLGGTRVEPAERVRRSAMAAAQGSRRLPLGIVFENQGRGGRIRP